MNKVADLNNYHDLGGLQQLRAQANKDPEDKEALKKAAQHFESIFIGMMLKSMRDANAVFEQDNPMHSNTTKFFRDMYDQQLATDMANKGSMGLADLIVQQLGGGSDNFKSASVLRNDSDLQRQAFGLGPSITKTADLAPESKQAFGLGPSVTTTADSEPKQAESLLNSFNQVIDKSFAQIGAKKPELTAQAQTLATASNQEPVKKPEVNFESPEDFVSSVWNYAKKAASKIGLNPAVMVAQSALETGWGKHIIKDKNGESSFNLFNVKAHRDWDGDKAAQSTLEFEKGVAVRKVEPFRVYNNFNEAFDDFVGFLKSNSRYQPALNNTSNSEQFLQDLQKAGYATDPKYAEKIIGILNSDRFKQVVGKVTNNKIGA